MIKLQHVFRIEKHNVFTKDANKIQLSANGDKRNIINRLKRNMYIWNR